MSAAATRPSQQEASPACAICFEERDPEGSNIVHLACKHIFDRACIADWLRRGSGANTDKCPVCVGPISPNGRNLIPRQDTPLPAEFRGPLFRARAAIQNPAINQRRGQEEAHLVAGREAIREQRDGVYQQRDPYRGFLPLLDTVRRMINTPTLARSSINPPSSTTTDWDIAITLVKRVAIIAVRIAVLACQLLSALAAYVFTSLLLETVLPAPVASVIALIQAVTVLGLFTRAFVNPGSVFNFPDWAARSW